MFIDTHCHIDDDKLLDKSAVVKSFVRDGVEIAINMGCDLTSSTAGKNLSEEFDQMYFGAGFHPGNLDDFKDGDLDIIASLSNCKKCVAIGEIGLDYHWPGYDKEKQKKVFISQLELAKSLKLPVSIHSRDATFDMLEILKTNKSFLEYGGVMHCFSGSVETATELIKLGLYISFAGPLTFKNANSLIEVASFVPMDMCLTETDSPYLAPHPLRGTVNEPKNVGFVTAKLAEIKGVSVESMAKNVMKNAKTLFKKL